MADRSGAEAYASGRIGLQELSTCNRRHRAAIWTARCLQDPLVELLKVDFNRLRLGSFNAVASGTGQAGCSRCHR